MAVAVPHWKTLISKWLVRNFTRISIPNMTKYYICELQFRNGQSEFDANADKEMRLERLCWLCRVMLNTRLSMHVFDFNGKLQNKWMITDDMPHSRGLQCIAYIRLNVQQFLAITRAHRTQQQQPQHRNKWPFREEIKWKIIIIKRQTRNHNAHVHVRVFCSTNKKKNDSQHQTLPCTVQSNRRTNEQQHSREKEPWQLYFEYKQTDGQTDVKHRCARSILHFSTNSPFIWCCNATLL